MKYGIESGGIDKFFVEGVKLASQTKYPEALLKFKKSLKKNPKHAPTYRNIAFLHLSLSQFDQLVKIMDTAIKKGIEDSAILHYKGYALKLLNKIDEAIEALNLSLKGDPEDCDTLLLLANCYRLLKNHELALKYYDKALLIDPLYDLVRDNKISMLQQLKKQDAIEKFREETAEFFYYKGLEYYNEEKYLASAIFYRKAIKYFSYVPAIDNLEKVLGIIDENPTSISKFGFESYHLNKWRNQGLIFLDMGDVGGVTITKIQEKIKEFIIQNDLPVGDIKMIPFDLIGINKTLLGIEILEGVFKKFNSIYNLPYFIFDSSFRMGACGPSQSGSMKELMEEYDIKQVTLSVWNDTNLTFFELGPKSITITETYERIFLLTNHLKINVNLFKMFPIKDSIIVAVEKYPGAYKSFQQKTGIKPITISRSSSK